MFNKKGKKDGALDGDDGERAGSTEEEKKVAE